MDDLDTDASGHHHYHTRNPSQRLKHIHVSLCPCYYWYCRLSATTGEPRLVEDRSRYQVHFHVVRSRALLSVLQPWPPPAEPQSSNLGPTGAVAGAAIRSRPISSGYCYFLRAVPTTPAPALCVRPSSIGHATDLQQRHIGVTAGSQVGNHSESASESGSTCLFYAVPTRLCQWYQESACI
jgi:hypothetical protein